MVEFYGSGSLLVVNVGIKLLEFHQLSWRESFSSSGCSSQFLRTVKEEHLLINRIIAKESTAYCQNLHSKPIAHAAEQIQVLSTVVQEMITLPSISPTASATDMQHWPVSPLEMRQWTGLLIALIGSTNFSS